MAKQFTDKSNYQSAYDCAKKGLALAPKSNQYLFNQELSLVSYYLDKKDEGYRACESVIFSSFAPYDFKNKALKNQIYYMSAIPFKKIIEIKYTLPNNYICSSSSLIPLDNGYRLNLRAVNYSINPNGSYLVKDSDGSVKTKNFLLTLNPDLTVAFGVELIDKSGLPAFSSQIKGMEDIRLFSNNEFLGTSLEVNQTNTPQICYGKFDPDSGYIEQITPLLVGTKLQCEKNWLPFVKNNEVYFVYTVHPVRIFKLDTNTSEVTEVKNETFYDDDLSSFRGSGGLIAYKDGWLGTIHQVYHGDRRKYFHRFIWYDHEFTKLRYSKLLYFETADIEFNLSICRSNDGLLIAYSQCDNNSKIGVIDYGILDAWLF